MYTVYMHTTPDNKRYVGVTSKPAVTRWQGGGGYASNLAFADAIKKHGWGGIKHEIISMCESHSEAIETEKQYVALYKTNDKQFGYNHTAGGEVPQDNAEFRTCFGNKLKELRIKAGLTQQEVSKAVGVYPHIVISWEKGKCVPRVDKAKALAEALGVQVDEILR